jgi:hypothetical protein
LSLQGQVFVFDDGGGEPVALELLEVVRLRPPGSAAVAGMRAEPFSLLFRSRDNQVLRSERPKIVAPGFEACEVFLPRVMPPAGRPAGAVYYQAIFT